MICPGVSTAAASGLVWLLTVIATAMLPMRLPDRAGAGAADRGAGAARLDRARSTAGSGRRWRLLAFLSMFRNPLRYFERRALGLPSTRPAGGCGDELPLILRLLWLIVGERDRDAPPRDHHWRDAYVLIALGIPLLGWVTWHGPGSGCSCCAGSVLRWPLCIVALGRAAGCAGKLIGNPPAVPRPIVRRWRSQSLAGATCQRPHD